MPAVIPFIPLIAAGVGAGTSIAAIKSQRGAAKDASRIEQQSTSEALRDAREQRQRDQLLADEDRAYQRERDAYGRSLDEREFGYRSSRDSVMDARFNDERDYGRGQFADYKSRLAPYGNIGTRATANLASVVGRALPAAMPTTGAGAMVRLQSPDGKIGEVPEGAVEHYLAKGATRV